MEMLGDTVMEVNEGIEVPLSAIEHFSYCPRQCALIHVEQTYEENLFTIKGGWRTSESIRAMTTHGMGYGW